MSKKFMVPAAYAAQGLRSEGVWTEAPPNPSEHHLFSTVVHPNHLVQVCAADIFVSAVFPRDRVHADYLSLTARALTRESLLHRGQYLNLASAVVPSQSFLEVNDPCRTYPPYTTEERTRLDEDICAIALAALAALGALEGQVYRGNVN